MMARLVRLTVFAIVLLAPSLAVCGQYRFPPPDFESGYELPDTAVPPARDSIYEYVDAAVFLLALMLASYLIHKKRSRRAIYGAIQNVTLTIFDSSYAIPITAVIFFVLPLAFTLFFGRTFCGAVCPLGMIQDVVLVRPVKVPLWLESALRLLAYAYLGAAVLFAATGSAFIICRYDPFVAFFRLSGNWNLLVFGASLLLIGLFVGRPYCRFLCPYGVLLRQFSRLSKWRVTITPTECIKCRLCEDACPFGAIREPTEDWPAGQYRIAKKRLALFLVLLPVLVAAGAWGGHKLKAPLARMHPTVRTAERVYLEETGQVEGTDDVSDAFRATGRASGDLYRQASVLRDRFALGGVLLGAFLGFVVAGKLIALSVRRRRSDYEADPAGCLACGRCYRYCPKEHERWKQKRERVPAH